MTGHQIDPGVTSGEKAVTEQLLGRAARDLDWQNGILAAAANIVAHRGLALGLGPTEACLQFAGAVGRIMGWLRRRTRH